MDGVKLWGVYSLNPTAEFNTSWRIVGAVDINRDGRTDLLWQNGDGNVAAWYMNGLNLVQAVGVGYGSIGGSNWKIVGPK
jgi:hypothetical protein